MKKPDRVPFSSFNRQLEIGNRQSWGFTLVEMVVVVAIVIIILLLVVPAASSLWADRKLADTVNIVQGMLMTSRARALRTDALQRGFLAYVDEEGFQHLAAIQQHSNSLGDPAYKDVFVFTDERDQIVPAPVRVIPRYAVCADDPSRGPDCGSDHDEPYELFDDVGDELDNESFERPAPPAFDQAQRHRNFFTMIFSTAGTLQINRDVIIQDKDEEDDPAQRGHGDRTGLRVSTGPPSTPTTTRYYQRDSTEADIDGRPDIALAFPFLIVDANDKAINFPSVDGLLVYDDSLFKAVPREQKRDFLLRTARPLYLSRCTGTMVKGPVGETP